MFRKNAAVLLIKCPDQKGLILKVSNFIFENRGNIIDCDQHVDQEQKIFYMRISWSLENFLIPKEKIREYFENLVGKPLEMDWVIHFMERKPQMAIFVSKYSHCLFDILARVHSGELKVDVPIIISNHNEFKEDIEKFDIPFKHIPVTKQNKAEAEAEQLEVLKSYDIDFVVLARYMQILSPNFVSHYREKIINIHHSFLPAFPGPKPYHSAFNRGVKIIGATSHYVTDDLDEGPIIEQDVTKLGYKDDVQDMIRKGRDLEKIVLARAVFRHVNRNLIVNNNRTITF